MDNFSISQLQQLSGIKAHTIRIWEQRYNALTPDRSEGNTRSYNNHQLKRLLNIVSLLEEGYKISQLGGMSDQELHQLLALKLKDYTISEDKNEYFVSQLIASAMSYDEARFDEIYNQCINDLGLATTYNDVLFPMLRRMGLLWGIDAISPAQEHFSSHLIKRKISAAIDGSAVPAPGAKTWLLFLPENEFHDIPLLYSNFLLRQAGHKVIYLGSNVPADTLHRAVEEVDPTDMLFFFVHYINPDEAKAYLDMLISSFPNVNLHCSGNESLIGQLELSSKINWIKSPEDFSNKVNQK